MSSFVWLLPASWRSLPPNCIISLQCSKDLRIFSHGTWSDGNNEYGGGSFRTGYRRQDGLIELLVSFWLSCTHLFRSLVCSGIRFRFKLFVVPIESKTGWIAVPGRLNLTKNNVGDFFPFILIHFARWKTCTCSFRLVRIFAFFERVLFLVFFFSFPRSSHRL